MHQTYAGCINRIRILSTKYDWTVFLGKQKLRRLHLNISEQFLLNMLKRPAENETEERRNKKFVARSSPIRLGSDCDDFAQSSSLSRALKSNLEDLRGLIICRVCIRPLYEPFTISCGHTFCYGCLLQWFGQNRTKKTCPDCRSKVLQQPAPAYLVRPS